MRQNLSWRVNLIGAALIALMLRASYWQWGRYEAKLQFISQLENNLELPAVPLRQLVESTVGRSEAIHRRVLVEGEYDFEHEMVLKNRKHEDDSGFFVITPLKIKGLESFVLVNRGFIPFSGGERTARTKFQKQRQSIFKGLIKPSTDPKFLAPADPQSGRDRAWVDGWLRVDIPKMAKQLPYAVLPFYLEVMAEGLHSTSQISSQIVRSTAGKEELFFLPMRTAEPRARLKQMSYPIPVFDPVVPPDRHLGYVYEWMAMAVLTALICFVLQLKPILKR